MEYNTFSIIKPLLKFIVESGYSNYQRLMLYVVFLNLSVCSLEVKMVSFEQSNFVSLKIVLTK
jgi:hypothetical protein